MAKTGTLTEAERVEVESKKEMIDSIPKVIIYGATILLIWAFTNFVFYPLGKSYDMWGINTGSAIALVGMIAMIVLIIKVLKEVRDIADAVGGLIAVNVGRGGASKEEVGHWKMAIRGVLYVILVALVFSLFATLLSKIAAWLAGIILLIVFIWAVLTLYKSGMAVSKEIESYATEQSKKMLEKEAKD